MIVVSASEFENCNVLMLVGQFNTEYYNRLMLLHGAKVKSRNSAFLTLETHTVEFCMYFPEKFRSFRGFGGR